MSYYSVQLSPGAFIADILLLFTEVLPGNKAEVLLQLEVPYH